MYYKIHIPEGLRLNYYRHLASFGAIITVLLVTIEPFLQQIVEYAVIPVDIHPATVPRSDNYTLDQVLAGFSKSLINNTELPN